MDRNIKYKQVCRVGLFGDDDVFTSTNSQYNVFPSSIPGITVVAGGSNYTATATQIFLSNNNNSGFMATANISGGAINTITINNGGSLGPGEPYACVHRNFVEGIKVPIRFLSSFTNHKTLSDFN